MSDLRDQYARPLRDLRISVTDRCNFRCPYCMPAEVFGPDHAFLHHSQFMSLGELRRILQQFRRESETTARLLKAYPANKGDLKPAEKSRSAKELGWVWLPSMALPASIEVGSKSKVLPARAALLKSSSRWGSRKLGC